MLLKVVNVQSPSQLSLNTLLAAAAAAAAASGRGLFNLTLSDADLSHSLGQWKRWQDNEYQSVLSTSVTHTDIYLNHNREQL